MTFAPKIDVLTRQPAVLEPPDLSFDAILQRFPGLAKADTVLLTGSIAAGWRSAFSDVDLYAFSDHQLDLPVDETMETWPGGDEQSVHWMRWVGRYADARVDLMVWPTDSVAVALEPLLGANEPEYFEAGEAIETLLYRVSIGQPLKGAQRHANMRRMIDESNYARVVARSAKFLAETALKKVAGRLQSGDHMTALIQSMRAAVWATDARLLLAGDLCRWEEWILRRLERTPACGITIEEYRVNVLGTPRPDETDAAAALRLARWAQSQLTRAEDELLA